MRPIVTAIVMLLLAGCVSSGTKVEIAQLDQFTPGVTTLQQVIDRFGPPNATAQIAGGGQVIVYGHTEAYARPETYIPFIGGFVGGANASSTMASLTFDARGILVRTSWSGSHTQ